MGLPVKAKWDSAGTSSTLPFRGYNLIYNQWFRDENFCAPAAFVTNDGPDTNSWYNLLKRAKERRLFHDCATTTTEIHGTERAALGTAPITGIGQSVQTYPIVNIAVSETGGVAAVYRTHKDRSKQPAISTSKAPPQPAATLKFTPISPQQLA